MKDKDEKIINSYRDALCVKFYSYLKKQGQKFVDENYYDIQTFTKIFLNRDFLKFLLQLGTTYNFDLKTKLPVTLRGDISVISHNKISRIEAHNKLPISFRPFIFYFVKSNANIVETFTYFISKKSVQKITTPSLNPVVIDSRSYKTQLIAGLDPSSGYIIKGLSLTIFKNTKIFNLIKFLNSKLGTDTITSLQSSSNSLPEYPHSKIGKINYYQKIKEYLWENKKKLAKTKNRKSLSKNRDNDIDYENEPLPDTDEQIAAEALGKNKYFKLENVKAGVNILRQRRKRLKDKLKTS